MAAESDLVRALDFNDVADAFARRRGGKMHTVQVMFYFEQRKNFYLRHCYTSLVKGASIRGRNSKSEVYGSVPENSD
ncbi:uncharacterized protein V6R79_003141 [Siganus canaliculatus]